MTEPPVSTAAQRGVLVGVDLRGIQDFVYEGRRLLDAVGRSAMVGDLVNTDPEKNKRGIVGLLRDVDCAVLRDTGGALWVAFTGTQADADARTFTAHYTRTLHEVSVRIQPVVVHLPFGGGEKQPADLNAAVHALGPRLAAKGRNVGHTPVLGYGVTALCEVTGRPAETVDPSRGQETPEDQERSETPPERVAADVLRARDRGRTWHQDKNDEWLGDLDPFHDKPFDLPMNVEQLGRQHVEVSRQAVMHLDFNDLGKTLRAYGDALRGTADHTEQMRKLSGQVRELTEGLARAMSRAVAEDLTEESKADPKPVLRGSLPDQILRAAVYQPRKDRPKTFVKVPLRPIVAGGDDLTVICDGRLAWSLVRFALDWLDKVDVPPRDPRIPFIELGQDNTNWDIKREVGGDEAAGVPPATTGVPTMKVGIAVQPVGAPLIAGYNISDRLAKAAKDYRRDTREPEEHAVAWSLYFDTPERVLDRMQHRIDGNGGKLTAQPMLGSTFREFLENYFRVDLDRSLRGENWRENRSWLIGALAKLLEQGHNLDVELARRKGLKQPHELPALPASPGDLDDPPSREAWLFEALELLDLHLDVDLKEVP